jgi:hypothetical protein
LFLTLPYKFAIRRIQTNQGRLKLNETHEVLIKEIVFFCWAQTNAQALAVDTKDVCLNVNTTNTEHMNASCEQKVQEIQDINLDKIFENCNKSKVLGNDTTESKLHA